MKSIHAALLLLGLIVSVAAAPKEASRGFDIAQPQSPPRPAPKWLKLVDQGRTDPRLKGYRAPEGVKVEIVADFPVVTNPVGMAFADDGAPHVLEWRFDAREQVTPAPETCTYKDGSKRTIVVAKKHVKDVVKVLTDSQGKGYDQAKVVLEEELPSSLLFHDGWLYISGRGSVRRYKRSKADGPYDVKEVVAHGFGGYLQRQVSGLSIGLDGWLYISTGAADNHVEGADGSRATVLRTGAIFRCRPDGAKMHVYSIGYCNPYRDPACDAAGNLFHADNDAEDAGKFSGCRLMHVAEDGDFGWRVQADGALDPLRAAVFGELPGTLPPMLKTGRGAPAGLLCYNDSRFPEPYRGLLFYPDVQRQLIRAYRLQPKGATFAVAEEFEFLKSEDPLFRPCHMVVGPDGALYVCDWRTASSDAGQLAGDGKHGRIYRLSWAGNEEHPALPLRGLDSWAAVRQLDDDDLFEMLAGDDYTDRLRAQRELVRRGDQHRPALLKILADADEPTPARLASLGALHSFWNEEVQNVFIVLMRDRETSLRRLAVEGLARHGKRDDRAICDALVRNLEESDPAVRRAMYLALGRIGGPGAADSLINVLKSSDMRDPYLYDGLLRGLERLGQTGIDKLVDLAESGVEMDHERVLDAFPALRSPAALSAIPRLLAYPHLSIKQQTDLHKLLLNGLEAAQGEARLAAIEAVAGARLAAAAPRLTQLAADSKLPEAERAAAAKALRILGDNPSK